MLNNKNMNMLPPNRSLIANKLPLTSKKNRSALRKSISYHFNVPENEIPTDELQIINNIIRNSKPTILQSKKKRGEGFPWSSSKRKQIILPPNKSMIVNLLPLEYHHKLSKLAFGSKKHEGPKDVSERNKTLPIDFTWKGDSLILPASNQGMCGSCWAFAGCEMFSDVIAITTKGQITPNISPTYLLSCKQQFGCEGGYPSLALDDLVKFGAVANSCIDYSWCKRNNICDGNALNHFDNPSDYLNSKIPTCTDCQLPSMLVEGKYVVPLGEDTLPICTPDQISDTKSQVNCLQKGGKIDRFYGKHPHSIYARTDANGDVMGSDLEDVIYDVEEHIIKHGPVIGTYLILSNFMNEGSGLFNETGGVYIDNYQYKNPNGDLVPKDNRDDDFNPTPFAIAGGHAVVIVGYGDMYISAINPDTGEPYGDIDYWDVRNSWGREWGEDGFFRMATYPTSKFSQFDVGLNVGRDESGNTVWLGGFSLIELDKIVTMNVSNNKVEYHTDTYDDESYPIPDREITDNIIQTPWHSDYVVPTYPTPDEKKTNLWIIIVVLLSLAILVFILYIMYKRNT